MKENNKKDSARVLLVDDDPNLVVLISDYLKFKGFNVLTATNGQQALEMLKISTADLIICDILMPVMDGYTFVRKLRSEFSTECLPVIFLSAKSESSDRIKGLNIGADAYMIKPFEPEELVAQVRSSLRQQQRLSHHQKIALNSSFTRVPQNIELTQTESKVIQFVAQGLSNREISRRLNVSQRTIESHVSNMLSKTNLHNRTELSRWALAKNLA